MSTFNLFENENNIHRYNDGDTIFAQDTDANFMYDVVEGEVVLYRDGREITRLKKGEIFGETALINNEAHSVTAIAASNSTIAKISKRQFLFMVTETPNFALKIMSILAERLSKETAKNLR